MFASLTRWRVTEGKILFFYCFYFPRVWLFYISHKKYAKTTKCAACKTINIKQKNNTKKNVAKFILYAWNIFIWILFSCFWVVVAPVMMRAVSVCASDLYAFSINHCAVFSIFNLFFCNISAYMELKCCKNFKMYLRIMSIRHKITIK